MIAACVKWVAGLPEPGDERFAGTSAADQAALELALRQAEASGDSVTVVTAGPPAAERALRDALACGAAQAIRVDLSAGAPSAAVAAALATTIGDARFVWCGDWSDDRGSGTVPAFLAAALGARQALGAVSIELGPDAAEVTRRLDGGRREVLRAAAPAVISVEGSVARLRRAGLAAALAARNATVTVSASPAADEPPTVAHGFRPRPKSIPAPHGSTALDRLRELTDAAGVPARGETLHLEAGAAAARIVAALRDWGYLDAPSR